MTGQEHYQAAEELLSGLWADRDQSGESRDRDIACAQVHATLALVAATVGTGVINSSRWQQVTES